MNWDRVSRENMYRRNGYQVVAGADKLDTTKKKNKPKPKKKAKAKGFPARYPGTCIMCKMPIVPGDEIKMFDKGKAYHVACLSKKS